MNEEVSKFTVTIMTFNTPIDIEPLPLYRRDPESSSIISSAPSYVSEAPSYRSRRPSVPEAEATTPAGTPRSTPSTTTLANTQPSSTSNTNLDSDTAASNDSPNAARHQQGVPRRTGLPPLRYAPGYHRDPVSNLDVHAYNIGAWSSITTSHASRQLHAVARRRASQAVATTTCNMLNCLASSSSPPSSLLSTPAATNSAASPNTNGPAPAPEPLLPQEDPDLVGELAAARARSSRLYRERCLRGEEAFRHEGKTWDFMLAQMADWEERERSWRGFREQVGRTKLLGRRIGLK